MKIKQLTCALLLAVGLVANAANEPNTVYQVTEEVTVSENVDYIIAHTTPFVGEGRKRKLFFLVLISQYTRFFLCHQTFK